MWVYVFAVGIIMFTVEPETFDTFLDAAIIRWVSAILLKAFAIISKALSKESIVQELENNCDKQFDESIVRILIDIIEDDAFEDMKTYVVSN